MEFNSHLQLYRGEAVDKCQSGCKRNQRSDLLSFALLCFVLQQQPPGFWERWAHFAACQGSHCHRGCLLVAC